MDLEWITAKAKDILFECKEFPPCLFVEVDHNMDCILGVPQIHEVDSGQDRARLLFFAGRTFALKRKKSLKKQKITGVCLVAEIWYAPPPKPGYPFIRATYHPQRKEGLSFATIDPVTMEQKMQTYEILRSGSNLDLLKETSFDETIGVGPGLPSFLAGARTAKQDISLAIHELRRICERFHALVQESLNSAG